MANFQKFLLTTFLFVLAITSFYPSPLTAMNDREEEARFQQTMQRGRELDADLHAQKRERQKDFSNQKKCLESVCGPCVGGSIWCSCCPGCKSINSYFNSPTPNDSNPKCSLF